MSAELPPPPVGTLATWGERLNSYLVRVKDKLSFKTGDARAVQDGVLLWDTINSYPVVSKNGEWRQIVLEDGRAFLYINSDITAAASNTAYALTFTSSATDEGITLDGSKIYFDEGGHYLATFTAQVYSTNSAAQTFYFFPRINGTDVPLGATRATLAANGQTQPVTKSAVLSVSTGDYLEAIWATSDHTKGSLEAFAATAFAPASPSVSLTLMRIAA